MTEEIMLYPSADFFAGLIGQDNGTTNLYTYINEIVANDSNYLQPSLYSGTGLFDMQKPKIPSLSQILKITFYARFKCANVNIAGEALCNFQYYNEGQHIISSLGNIATSFTLYSWEQVLNQATGKAWTVNDLYSSFFGINLFSYSGATKNDPWNSGFCSQFNMKVTAIVRRPKIIIF